MSDTRIEAHPEFPFRTGREEALQAKARGFLDIAGASNDQERLVHEFLILVHRYAFLERLIQGDILYDLPIHREVIGEETGIAVEDQAERLAAAERQLIGWTERPAGELAERLEEMGIKILFLQEPQEGEAPPVAPCGGFFFEGETGPALLVGAPAGSAEAAFIVAHEFAHLIADINPYRSRFCRWNPGVLTNLVDSFAEARADRFARALLLPDEEVRAALARFAADNRDANEPIWQELSAIFEVPLAVLHARVEDLGIPAPEGALAHAEPRSAPRAGNGSIQPEAHLLALSERFVNLALAAYAERVFDPTWLARFLRTTEQNARRMLDWAGISQRPDSAEDE